MLILSIILSDKSFSQPAVKLSAKLEITYKNIPNEGLFFADIL